MSSVLFKLGYVKDLEQIFRTLSKLASGTCDRQKVEQYISQQINQNHITYYAYDDRTGNAKVCREQDEEAFLKTVRTGCKDRSGQNLMVRYRKNRSGVWVCEGISHQNHLDMVLNTYQIGYLSFPNFHQANQFIEELHGKLLAGEKWSFAKEEGNPESYRRKTNYQILESYLQQVFAKLVLEYRDKASENYEKIVFSADGRYCYFNTGLLTKFARSVFIVGEVKNRRNSGEFQCHEPAFNVGLRDLVNEYGFAEDDVNPGPDMATFFSDISEIIYDTNVDIDFTDDKLSHVIIDGLKRNRFPKRYQLIYEEQEDAAVFGLAEKLRSSIEASELIAKRNFKYVVPQYRPAYVTTVDGKNVRREGEIQFLMPIYLDFNLYEMPDFALVLSYEGGFYVPETILPLSWAYNNARILCKPDEPWLVASRIEQDENDSHEEALLKVLEQIEESDAIDHDGKLDLPVLRSALEQVNHESNQDQTKKMASAASKAEKEKEKPTKKAKKSERRKKKSENLIGQVFILENIRSANNGGIKGTFGDKPYIATVSRRRLGKKRIPDLKDREVKVRIMEKNHHGDSYQAEMVKD